MIRILSILLLCSTAFAAWPAYFVPNVGQWEGEFAYRCDVGNGSYWITSSGMTIAVYENDERGTRNDERRSSPSSFPPVDEPGVVRGHALMMRFVDANPCFELVSDESLTSYSNYFKGRDSCQWHSRVPNYQRVIAKEVWPGIDVEYKADQRGVETVFRVQPGADLSRIIIEYEGLNAPLRLDSHGNLVLITSVGELHEQAPFAFQNDARIQKSIPMRYSVLSNSRYGFDCDNFEVSKELVIDPLVYSTFIAGSTRDTFLDMTKDSSSSKLVCGDTWRSNFPTTPGAFQEEGTSGGFIMKFTPLADSLIFSTYVSGGGGGAGKILTLADESIFFISDAFTNYPVTENAFDTATAAFEVGFIHLTSRGDSLLYGSFLGGSDHDILRDSDVDSLSQLYIYGETRSPDFPLTSDAMYPTFQPYRTTFVSIFNPVEETVVYSTYINSEIGNIPSSPICIDVVAPGRIWLSIVTNGGNYPTTPDALIAEYPGEHCSFFGLVDLHDGTFVYGSYLGEVSDSFRLVLTDIVAVENEQIWLGGFTNDPYLPMPAVAYNPGPPQELDGFVFCLQLPNQLLHGTFLGGSGNEVSVTLYPAASENILVCGSTESADFPTTLDAFDSTLFIGEFVSRDAFLCQLSSNLVNLAYGTYIGGEESEWPNMLIFDRPEAIWLGGETYSVQFPITQDAMFTAPSHGFLMQFSLPPQSVMPRASILSSFTFSAYPNPFNPATTLVYSLPHPSRVILDVFNTLGQQVKRVDMGRVIAGDHRYLFAAGDLSSGTYFARLHAEEFSQTRKMVVVR